MKLKLFVIAACASLSVFFVYQDHLRIAFKQTNNKAFSVLFSFRSPPVLKDNLEFTDGSECQCSRFLVEKDKYTDTESLITENEIGTCSRYTSALKSGQRVVSYTYFQGHNIDPFDRDYFSGIRLNLEKIRNLYPGYRMRLYYRIDKNSALQEELCEIACSEDILDLCDVNQLPTLGNVSSIYPLIWRFLPVLDSQVDLVLSRDLDSVITSREQAAVQEFLNNSQKSFHVMRDHEQHNLGILGGTWAAKLDMPPMRDVMKAKLSQILNDKKVIDPGTSRGIDQDMLMRYVWPSVVKNGLILAHDSHFCKKYPSSIGFPTRRKENDLFVGAVFGKTHVANAKKEDDRGTVFAKKHSGTICPEECRRGHKDWIYC